MNRNPNGLTDAVRTAWALALAWGGLVASSAQPMEGGVSRGFSAADVDSATGRRRWLLQGDTVNPLGRGVYEITPVRLVGYGEDGRTNLIAETDRCVFTQNTATTNLSGAGRLSVQAAEGQFSLEGVGYGLLLSQGQLTLSNDVRAILDKRILDTGRTNETPAAPGYFPLLATLRPATGPSPPGERLRIQSRQFRSETNRAVFLREVRVDDPQGRLTCESLEVQIDLARQRLETLVAKDAVVLEAGEIRAGAEVAAFDPRDESIRLSGRPKWSVGGQSGEADTAVVELRTGRLRAGGDTRFQLPAGSVAAGRGWLPSGSAQLRSDPASGAAIRVRADDFDYAPDPGRTNVAVAEFRGGVRVDDDRGSLTCGLLRVSTRRSDHAPIGAVAEQDVTIEQGSARVTCGRSEYDATTGVIDMTGDPAWQFEDKVGRSDRLRLDSSNQVYLAQGAVRMRADAQSIGGGRWFLPSGLDRRPTASPPAASEGLSTPPVEISCEEFEFRGPTLAGDPGRAVYRNRVRVVRGEEMELTCDQLVAALGAGTNQVDRLVAEGGVEMRSRVAGGERVARGDRAEFSAAEHRVELTGAAGVEVTLTDAAGRSVARGRRASYDGGRDLLELDGKPLLITPQGSLTGEVVRVDRQKGTFTASGHWQLRLPARALAGHVPGGSQ